LLDRPRLTCTKEMLMTRIVLFVCALTALLAVQARAADPPMHANSPKAEFSISYPLVVGDATLKPGTYRFQCVTIEGSDFLVVTNEDGKEVARVPCRPEELTAKTAVSEYRFTRRPDGTAELTGVRLRGEKIEHRIATN
jgi:hypothetical protein